MDDFLKMDIFFVVATTVTALIGALAIVALVYAVKFLRTLNRIGTDIEEETEALRKDIQDARARVRGFRFAQLFSLLGFTAKRARRKKTNE